MMLVRLYDCIWMNANRFILITAIITQPKIHQGSQHRARYPASGTRKSRNDHQFLGTESHHGHKPHLKEKPMPSSRWLKQNKLRSIFLDFCFVLFVSQCFICSFCCCFVFYFLFACCFTNWPSHVLPFSLLLSLFSLDFSSY